MGGVKFVDVFLFLPGKKRDTDKQNSQEVSGKNARTVPGPGQSRDIPGMQRLDDSHGGCQALSALPKNLSSSGGAPNGPLSLSLSSGSLSLSLSFCLCLSLSLSLSLCLCLSLSLSLSLCLSVFWNRGWSGKRGGGSGFQRPRGVFKTHCVLKTRLVSKGPWTVFKTQCFLVCSSGKGGGFPRTRGVFKTHSVSKGPGAFSKHSVF